jgi:hypothetical protein
MLETTTLEQVLNIHCILLHLSGNLVISSSMWMIISATACFAMVLIVCGILAFSGVVVLHFLASL